MNLTSEVIKKVMDELKTKNAGITPDTIDKNELEKELNLLKESYGLKNSKIQFRPKSKINSKTFVKNNMLYHFFDYLLTVDTVQHKLVNNQQFALLHPVPDELKQKLIGWKADIDNLNSKFIDDTQWDKLEDQYKGIYKKLLSVVNIYLETHDNIKKKKSTEKQIRKAFYKLSKLHEIFKNNIKSPVEWKTVEDIVKSNTEFRSCDLNHIMVNIKSYKKFDYRSRYANDLYLHMFENIILKDTDLLTYFLHSEIGSEIKVNESKVSAEINPKVSYLYPIRNRHSAKEYSYVLHYDNDIVYKRDTNNKIIYDDKHKKPLLNHEILNALTTPVNKIDCVNGLTLHLEKSPKDIYTWNTHSVV